jgi:WD40 repeat protein
MTFSPNGKFLAIASFLGSVKIWNAATWTEVSTLTENSSTVTSILFEPNGTNLLTAAEHDLTVKRWVIATGQMINELDLKKQPGLVGIVNESVIPSLLRQNAALSAALSPDGRRFVTSTREGVAVWNTADFSRVTLPDSGPEMDTIVAVSPTVETVATISKQGRILLREISTGRQISSLPEFDDPIKSLDFSPDGKRLLGWFEDRAARRIWDVATGGEISLLGGLEQEIDAAKFSSNGRLIIAKSEHVVRLWDIATGREVATLTATPREKVDPDSPPVLTLTTMSPDSDALVTLNNESHAAVWDLSALSLPVPDLLQRACRFSLVGATKLSRLEMRLAGYPDSDQLKDVCEGVN